MNILLLLFILHTARGEFGTSYLKDRRLMNLAKDKNYCVVELTDPPSHLEVDQYVCVPSSWLVLREKPDIAVVKFPIEKLSVTKQRVKRREKHSDAWMIFVANVKYSTDSYKDAKGYILKEILKQARNSGTNDSEMTRSHTIHDMEPAANETDSELTSLPESDEEDCRTPTNKGKTVNTAKKQYLTRQSRKIPVTYTKATSSISLDPTSKEKPIKSHGYIIMKEGTNAKSIKDSQSIENNNQESNASSRRQLIDEQLINSHSNTIHKLSSIAGTALRDHDVHKTLEKISMRIKESIDISGTDLSKMKRPVFGKDFVGFMQDLYAQYDRCQNTLYDIRNQYIENCLTTKKIIGLVNKLNDLDADSNVAKATEATHASAKEKTNNNIVVINKGQSREAKKPKKKQTRKQKIVNTVGVNETIDDVTNNARTDQKTVKEIRKTMNFTLPPEYDPEDSKWTVRHPKMKKGLVELMPNTGVYVNAIELGQCKMLSRDTRTLARLLLVEVFNDKALMTCSVTGRRAHGFSGTDVRPGLDEVARTVLLDFVEQHARENNWEPSSRALDLHSMRNKLREYRHKLSPGKKKSLWK